MVKNRSLLFSKGNRCKNYKCYLTDNEFSRIFLFFAFKSLKIIIIIMNSHFISSSQIFFSQRGYNFDFHFDGIMFEYDDGENRQSAMKTDPEYGCTWCTSCGFVALICGDELQCSCYPYVCV